MSTDTICKRCGCWMSIPDDLESTDWCNLCAQDIAKAAKEFVENHKEDYEAMTNSESMDRDLEFISLCCAIQSKK